MTQLLVAKMAHLYLPVVRLTDLTTRTGLQSGCKRKAAMVHSLFILQSVFKSFKVVATWPN